MLSMRTISSGDRASLQNSEKPTTSEKRMKTSSWCSTKNSREADSDDTSRCLSCAATCTGSISFTIASAE